MDFALVLKTLLAEFARLNFRCAAIGAARAFDVLNDLNDWNVLNCFEAGAARALSEHDHLAPGLATFQFVEVRFPAEDFQC